MSQLGSKFASAPAAARPPRMVHIREEARAAILGEQLAYLLDHADGCGEDCPECARLRKVEAILMRPFATN